MIIRTLPRRAAATAVFVILALTSAGVGPAPGVSGEGEIIPMRQVAAAARSRDGQSRRLRLHNQTGWTMTRLYAVSARSTGRETHLLGAEALASGGSRALDLEDGSGACLFDFRAEFTNSQTLVRQGVNVCQIADYYFTR